MHSFMTVNMLTCSFYKLCVNAVLSSAMETTESFLSSLLIICFISWPDFTWTLCEYHASPWVFLNAALRLEQLSMPVLIDRLVLRKLFGLAILICQYLRVPDAEGENRIRAHWACYKVINFHIFNFFFLIWISVPSMRTPSLLITTPFTIKSEIIAYGVIIVSYCCLRYQIFNLVICDLTKEWILSWKFEIVYF